MERRIRQTHRKREERCECEESSSKRKKEKTDDANTHSETKVEKGIYSDKRRTRKAKFKGGTTESMTGAKKHSGKACIYIYLYGDNDRGIQGETKTKNRSS
jgi:hypothetical protein